MNTFRIASFIFFVSLFGGLQASKEIVERASYKVYDHCPPVDIVLTDGNYSKSNNDGKLQLDFEDFTTWGQGFLWRRKENSEKSRSERRAVVFITRSKCHFNLMKEVTETIFEKKPVTLKDLKREESREGFKGMLEEIISNN